MYYSTMYHGLAESPLSLQPQRVTVSADGTARKAIRGWNDKWREPAGAIRDGNGCVNKGFLYSPNRDRKKPRGRSFSVEVQRVSG